MLKTTLINFIFLFCFRTSFSQKHDTITINSSNLKVKDLKHGTNRYLVYYKDSENHPRTRHEIWTRTIETLNSSGNPVIVRQTWENNDTIFHKSYTVLHRKNMSTLYHEVWSRRAKYTFNFETKEAIKNGRPLNQLNDSISIKQVIAFGKACSQDFLTWHIDLEMFSILPLRENTTFKIKFYDPGFDAPEYAYYSVIGSFKLNGYDNQKIDCWLLAHGSLPENYQVFWISKKTGEVLKLEQEYSGKYRYKIKLGYSD